MWAVDGFLQQVLRLLGSLGFYLCSWGLLFSLSYLCFFFNWISYLEKENKGLNGLFKDVVCCKMPPSSRLLRLPTQHWELLVIAYYCLGLIPLSSKILWFVIFCFRVEEYTLLKIFLGVMHIFHHPEYSNAAACSQRPPTCVLKCNSYLEHWVRAGDICHDSNSTRIYWEKSKSNRNENT